ncbi:MAG: sel1 repeat family protein [Deltaproteobacteria bacterium]|nr:sel1 repeat family protein [Deltaproteobacteria bacterium]
MVSANHPFVVQASEPFGDGLALPSKQRPAKQAKRRWRSHWLPLTVMATLLLAGLGSVALRLEADRCQKGRVAECQRSCADGSPRSCNILGLMADEGDGVPLDSGRAVALYERACSGGRLAACGNLALSARYGEGMAVDLERAATLFAYACHADPAEEARSCNELAILYDEGLGVERDDARAATLYRQACHHGESQACANLTALFESGELTAA